MMEEMRLRGRVWEGRGDAESVAALRAQGWLPACLHGARERRVLLPLDTLTGWAQEGRELRFLLELSDDPEDVYEPPTCAVEAEPVALQEGEAMLVRVVGLKEDQAGLYFADLQPLERTSARVQLAVPIRFDGANAQNRHWQLRYSRSYVEVEGPPERIPRQLHVDVRLLCPGQRVLARDVWPMEEPDRGERVELLTPGGEELVSVWDPTQPTSPIHQSFE